MEVMAFIPPQNMTLGVYGASQDRVHAASRARDARINPASGFEAVYTADVDGEVRSFARVSVRALGWRAGGTYVQILEKLPGELCSMQAMEQIVRQVTEPGDVFYFAAPVLDIGAGQVYRGQKGNVWTYGHPTLAPALSPECDLVFMLPQGEQ